MRKRSVFFSLLALSIIVLLTADLAIGSVQIPFHIIWGSIIHGSTDNEIWNNIIHQFRIPKAATALLVGAGLGISGLQMQTLFRNPLAGPFVLGISSGANLGVALLMLASVNVGSLVSGIAINNWLIVLSASTGAILVFLLVLLISIKVRESMSLLIIGIMVASLTSALVGALQFFSSAENIQIYLIWTMGSLGGVTWEELYVFIPVVLTAVVLSFVIFKPLNGLLLGDSYAESMGINVLIVRTLIIISTSFLAGSITAFCGPIAFIGLAVPHLTRMIIETSDHRILIPAVGGMGIAVMLFCDIVSQLPGTDAVLPINIVTSFIGAPVVIWIILSGKAVKHSFS